MRARQWQQNDTVIWRGSLCQAMAARSRTVAQHLRPTGRTGKLIQKVDASSEDSRVAGWDMRAVPKALCTG